MAEGDTSVSCYFFIIYISVERTILHRNIYGSLTVPLLHHRGKIARNVLVTFLAPLLVRGGVGRLAGLSVPLAPVQWGGFVAWGAIPSTQVHPSLPALYPGQGGSGTTDRKVNRLKDSLPNLILLSLG